MLFACPFPRSPSSPEAQPEHTLRFLVLCSRSPWPPRSLFRPCFCLAQRRASASASVRHRRSALPRWMTNLNCLDKNVKGVSDKYTINQTCANEINSLGPDCEGDRAARELRPALLRRRGCKTDPVSRNRRVCRRCGTVTPQAAGPRENGAQCSTASGRLDPHGWGINL